MSRRILVVDDDVRVHELVRWALRAPRFEVHAFSDPQRALVRVLDVKPELIICDMMMPSMDGQVFLRLVKRAPELKKVPFLFLTAVRLGSEVQAALTAGADAYLVKPFPLAKLVETVETVLKQADSAADAPQGADAKAEEGSWPQTTPEDLLEALAAQEGHSDLTGSMGGRGTTLEAPGIPSADMATRGGTPLSDTSLAPPDRPEGAIEAPAADVSAAGPAPVFEGRFSTLDLEIGRVRVVTQAASRPNFVITTVLALEHDARGLKKIESVWCHPLHRHEDLELVKRQIDIQHERAVEEARHEPLFGPRRDVIWRRGSRDSENS